MLASKIKNTRESKNISQEELAKKVGLKQSQISKIENGTRQVKASELGLIANALDIPLVELLEEQTA